MFLFWWCVYIFLIIHHLENMEGFILERMVDFFYFEKI
jgi:hypothetical protein